MLKLINKIYKTKIFRYAIGGGSAAMLDLFFLWLFTDIMGVFYITSSVLAFAISVTYGYIFQKYITFEDKKKKHIRQWWLFLGFQLVGQGLYMLILWILVSQFQMHYFLVAIIAKIIIFGWNYIMNDKFNFNR